jgi:hypothetical protein
MSRKTQILTFFDRFRSNVQFVCFEGYGKKPTLLDTESPPQDVVAFSHRRKPSFIIFKADSP